MSLPFQGAGMSSNDTSARVLMRFVARIGAQVMNFPEGELVKLPYREAKKYQALGWLEILGEPAVKVTPKPQAKRSIATK